MTLGTHAHCGTPWPTGGPESEELLVLLGSGEMRLTGLMPWSSNYTFLGTVDDGSGMSKQVIYKPIRGERPLWDFPRGSLAKREVAAYLVCLTLGWHLVPPTVLRGGPHGKGSVQLYVDVSADAHFFTFKDDPQYRRALQALALFDIISNNADRKGGHCLSVGRGCIVAIDQGLCFHVEPKLRTVIWDFAGQPIPKDLALDLRRLDAELADEASSLTQRLSALLQRGEITTLRHRIVGLLDAGCYPNPPEDRRPYPWPLV